MRAADIVVGLDSYAHYRGGTNRIIMMIQNTKKQE